ncbi:YajQ family cyclic di-GMP-binding protein [Enterococcus viikkiensis]|uniref:Nucleotide-binding protein P7H59_02630 n=1 Tax=Enterococcus viikkiensis TaxID=930854 RepID=A0ABU3FMZ6_9ENTE|nr:YajQ family cyclic di-GMP-binding protein [Enterococcus viikkiensis]MDT2827345.1 YajQ family cyclic di-GMP-binding protein [Enterococcus viikkiensis]
MAKEASFDIVSELNKEEVKNGVQIALKELKNRFDFKGSTFDITTEGNQLVVTAEDDYKIEQVKEVLFNKLIKRGVPLKNIQFSDSEHALGGNARQKADLVSGIDKESAKKLTIAIKNSKIKVKAQIQEDQLRVTGKNRDDLQKVIALVKDIDLPIDLQFTNYR